MGDEPNPPEDEPNPPEDEPNPPEDEPNPPEDGPMGGMEYDFQPMGSSKTTTLCGMECNFDPLGSSKNSGVLKNSGKNSCKDNVRCSALAGSCCPTTSGVM